MKDAETTVADAWLDAQRAYWDAWFALTRQAVGAAAPAQGESAGGAWAEGLERWWQAVSPAASPAARLFLERAVEQAGAFFRLGESLAGAAAGGARPATAEAWQQILRSAFGPFGPFATPGEGATGWGGVGDGARRAFPFWELPLDTWRRAISSFSPLPGDVFEDVKTRGWGRMADALQERIDHSLSVPALGYTREWQERLQRWTRLVLDYQRAFQDYVAVFARLEVETLERFSRRLAGPAEKGEAVTTLRGLYDLWVDVAEELYAERVSTDEYAALYGRLTNALMALKRHGRDLADETLGALGLPTHAGLVTIQRRQQELRREVRTLREELARGRPGTANDSPAGGRGRKGARKDPAKTDGKASQKTDGKAGQPTAAGQTGRRARRSRAEGKSRP